jgi:hypothetical protein
MGFMPLVFHNSWDMSEVRTSLQTAECSNMVDNMAAWGWPSNASTSIYASTGENPTCPENEVPPAQTAKEEAMYIMYNRVIGGVRLRQERADEMICKTKMTGRDGGKTVNLKEIYGQPCYPSRFYLRPDLADVIGQENPDLVDKEGGETEWFLLPGDLTEIRSQLNKMEERRWFAQATQRVELAMPSYNAIENAISMIYINFYMTSGGHLFKDVEVLSLWIDLYRGRYTPLLADFTVLLIFIYILSKEIHEVHRHIEQLGCRRGLKVYADWQAFVDWITVLATFSLGCDL